MIRTVGFVLAAFAMLLLLVPLGSGTVVPHDSAWTFAVTNPSVPLGTPVFLAIQGPSNGTFSINVTAPPFDHSYSVFFYTFVMPYSPNGTPTYLNISIPTDALNLGAYQIQILNGSDIIGAQIVRMEIPGNVTQLQYNLTQDEILLAALKHSVGMLSDQVRGLVNILTLLVAVGIAGPTISVVLVAMRDRASRDERFMQGTRKWLKQTFRRRAYTEYDDIGLLQEDKDLPSQERIYRSGYCDDCRSQLWALEEIITHIKEEHLMQLAATQDGEPKEGVDFYKDQKQLKDIERAYAMPTPSKRQRKERSRSFGVDIDQIIGKGG